MRARALVIIDCAFLARARADDNIYRVAPYGAYYAGPGFAGATGAGGSAVTVGPSGTVVASGGAAGRRHLAQATVLPPLTTASAAAAPAPAPAGCMTVEQARARAARGARATPRCVHARARARARMMRDRCIITLIPLARACLPCADHRQQPQHLAAARRAAAAACKPEGAAVAARGRLIHTLRPL
jgi:hypothetical protein